MTPTELMVVIGIAWTCIWIYTLTNNKMDKYTDEDMAKAYTMGYDSRSKNIGMLLRKFDEVVGIGKRLRVGSPDEIACAEFDKVLKEIEKPASEDGSQH